MYVGTATLTSLSDYTNCIYNCMPTCLDFKEGDTELLAIKRSSQQNMLVQRHRIARRIACSF